MRSFCVLFYETFLRNAGILASMPPTVISPVLSMRSLSISKDFVELSNWIKFSP